MTGVGARDNLTTATKPLKAALAELVVKQDEAKGALVE